MPRTPRRIRPTAAFRRDFKREDRGRYCGRLARLLRPVVEALAVDDPLPPANRDHPLSGDWADCRECHIRPNLLLIYRKPSRDVLDLVRLGSHSTLFGG